jgi:mRNA interferase MazF
MKPGEIVVIPFPFTDLAGKKIRPAYVLSNEKYNNSRNIIVAAISTKPGVLDLAIELSQEDLESGKLQKKSYIRLQNIFTIEKRLIQQKVGECTVKKKDEVHAKLLESF